MLLLQNRGNDVISFASVFPLEQVKLNVFPSDREIFISINKCCFPKENRLCFSEGAQRKQLYFKVFITK